MVIGRLFARSQVQVLKLSIYEYDLVCDLSYKEYLQASAIVQKLWTFKLKWEKQMLVFPCQYSDWDME